MGFFNIWAASSRKSAYKPRSAPSAARVAHIHEFIAGLPKGYDTFIGERQRLAIARALLKDAPILVFDEPTANLDPLTEQQILTTLFETMRGKASLLITHRLVGLEDVDEIRVMEQGKIVERGNHYSLLAQDGLYRCLWDLQNKILFFDQALQTHPVSHKFESFV